MMEVHITRTSPDELKHFGIKGQKWGVRRFENPDGTLTEEGKARYRTSEAQRSLADTAKSSMYRGQRTSWKPDSEDARVASVGHQLRNHPAVKDAAKRVSSEYKAYKDLDDQYWNEVESFYNNKEVYEKYLNQAVDKFMKDVGPDWGKRQQAYDWFKYDDGDQGDHSSLDLYRQSPEGKKLNQIQKACADAYKTYSDACKTYISEYTGVYGNEIVNPGSNYERTVNARLSDFVKDVAERPVRRY